MPSAHDMPTGTTTHRKMFPPHPVWYQPKEKPDWLSRPVPPFTETTSYRAAFLEWNVGRTPSKAPQPIPSSKSPQFQNSLTSRRSCVLLAAAQLVPAAKAKAASTLDPTLESYTFAEQRLGLEFSDAGPRVRISSVRPDSVALAKGMPPASYIVNVDGRSTAGLSAAQVQALIQSAPRPVTIRVDASEFRALSARQQTEAAATALGMETQKLKIELLTGPQDPKCAFKTRASDVVEIEFSGRLASSGLEFDSSEMRSGRPFAFTLGNGDVVRGLDLGTLEMCIGEERLLLVPSRLGFGTRGSKVFGVPPDAPLDYRVRLVSINMITDPKARRAVVDDEQRYSEDESGDIVNAAGL
jgi:FK506-binding protein 2